MTTYFKATRPDGTDFHTGTIDYAAALASGEIVQHPTSKRKANGDAATYLSISTVATDCTGFSWPARLFAVAPIGAVGCVAELPNKRTCLKMRV